MRSETVSIPICDYAAAACSTVENRLYYNPTDSSFQDSTAGVGKEKIYDVTQVRPNDGLYLNEAISL